jgi:hypothetical protein
MPERRILCADALSYLPPVAFIVRALAADAYLLADDIQFSTNGFCHRAKIKTPGGASLLALPVLTKGRGRQLIKEIEIDNSRHWQRRHWRSIEVNYCHAPYFGQFADELQALFERPERFLREINISFIKALWRWLQMPSKWKLTSAFPSSLKKEERLVDLCQKAGANLYLCDQKYQQVLSLGAFADAGIRPCFADFSGPAYPQLFAGFTPGLSMLDVLLNEGPQTARKYLDEMAGRVRAEIAESGS